MSNVAAADDLCPWDRIYRDGAGLELVCYLYADGNVYIIFSRRMPKWIRSYLEVSTENETSTKS